ncbi:MAG: zf-HC2 domain-containing protein [Planctomycetota bacterium]
MNCESVKKFIDDYVFELLNAEEANVVEAHISACESCRKTVEEAKQFRKSVSSSQLEIKPREGFANKVVSNIWRKKYGSFVTICKAVTVAASILIAAIIYLQFSSMPSKPQPVVLGSSPVVMTNSGIVQESVEINVDFPEYVDSGNVFIFLRTLPVNGEPASVTVEINEKYAGSFFQDATESNITSEAFSYLLGWEAGLRAGKNIVRLRNNGTEPVKYEIVSCYDALLNND